MAHAAADLLIHEYLRMGGASFHHASSGQYQRPARDLRATYAQSSSVFHRRGNALPRSQGLARHGFPPYALVVFILMSIPLAVVLVLVATPNVGWLFMCATTGMYLIYEFMHFCCHVDENWFVRHCP